MNRGIRLAVFVSGEGTLLEELGRSALRGEVPVEIVLVVADREPIRALDRARALGVPTFVARLDVGSASNWSSIVSLELRRRGVELVLLAGFLSILPPEFLGEWPGRIVNVHPSLLPRFGGPGMYGRRVHEAVLAAGDPETGATVHVVTAAVDSGPVLAVERVPVVAGDSPDSLRARIRPAELRAIHGILRRVAEGDLVLPFRRADPSVAPG